MEIKAVCISDFKEITVISAHFVNGDPGTRDFRKSFPNAYPGAIIPLYIQSECKNGFLFVLPSGATGKSSVLFFIIQNPRTGRIESCLDTTSVEPGGIPTINWDRRFDPVITVRHLDDYRRFEQLRDYVWSDAEFVFRPGKAHRRRFVVEDKRARKTARKHNELK